MRWCASFYIVWVWAFNVHSEWRISVPDLQTAWWHDEEVIWFIVPPLLVRCTLGNRSATGGGGTLIHARRILGEKQAKQVMIAFSPFSPPSVRLWTQSDFCSLCYSSRRWREPLKQMLDCLTSLLWFLINYWRQKKRPERSPLCTLLM